MTDKNEESFEITDDNFDELFSKKFSWPVEFYYKCWRGFNWLKERPRRIKWFCERGWRGYSQCDVWNLYSYLSSWMPEALKELQDNMQGRPLGIEVKGIKDDAVFENNLTKEEEERLFKEWKRILKRIEKGFRAVNWDDEEDNTDEFFKAVDARKKGDESLMNEYEFKRAIYDKMAQRGLNLFVKYFRNLWD